MKFPRRYLIVVAGRHSAVAILAFFFTGLFRAHSFEPMRQILPLDGWALIYLLVAVTCWASLLVRRLRAPAVSLSAMLTFCWTALFIYAGSKGLTSSPTQPVMWMALGLKDIAFLSDRRLSSD